MRRLLPHLLLLVPLPLLAQAQLRYQYTRVDSIYLTPNAWELRVRKLRNAKVDVRAIEQAPRLSIRKTTTTLTLASRDSAGGKLWTVNAAPGVIVHPLIDVAEAKLDKSPPPDPRAPAWRMQVFLKNGVPVGMQRDWQPMTAPHRSNPVASLLLEFPGTGLLVPLAVLPARNGGTRRDTLIMHSTMNVGAALVPPSNLIDSIVTRWARTATVLQGTADRTKVRSSTRSTTVTTERTLSRVTWGADRRIASIQANVNERMTSTMHDAKGTGAKPGDSLSVRTIAQYTITRIP